MAKQKLSNNQEYVLKHLRAINEWTTLTAIAAAFGHTIRRNGRERGSSSWASPICKKLEAKGLIERDNHGWCRYLKRTRRTRDDIYLKPSSLEL